MSRFREELKIIAIVALGAIAISGIYGCKSQKSTISHTTVKPTEKPTEAPTQDRLTTMLSEMSLHEKICQMFIVAPEVLLDTQTAVVTAGEDIKSALATYPVGGIICFGSNLVDREQTKTLLANMQEFSRIRLFVAVDEEGGRVARLGNNPAMEVTKFAPMGEIVDAYNVGYTIGTEIKELGFNLDFAPVADINSNPNNPIIGDRSFGDSAECVATQVKHCVQGFIDSKMLCTLKHFPGHGDTATDSHLGDAIQYKTIEELKTSELIPFKAGIDAGAQFVMVGHILSPNVEDEGLPASLSTYWIEDILRKELGFNGIVITDALSMKAVSGRFESGEAAVAAVQAGVDILLQPENLAEAVASLENAVKTGIIAEARIDESVLRILKIKNKEFY